LSPRSESFLDFLDPGLLRQEMASEVPGETMRMEMLLVEET
jgi:hypothetical protein